MIHFIAEISSNHARDLKRSLQFVDLAADIGCSSVKFQLFKIDQLFSHEILNASEEHLRRKKWELPFEFIPEISSKSRDRNIEFGCTPFYLDAVEQLFPYVDYYKVASYELLWDELLRECALTNKPVIISTGMATIDEIEHAIETLDKYGCKDPVVMHCVSAYPTPHEESNLSAIETIRNITSCKVGWSDHTHDPAVLYRAIHRWGAEFIEFHLDIDGTGEEFSPGHCWLPDEIDKVIRDVSLGLKSDGSGIKKPSISEADDRDWRADPIDGLRPMRDKRKQFEKT
jgi:N-acetylneuraminate synthase